MIRLDYRPAKLNQDHSGKGREVGGVVTKTLTFAMLEVPIDEDELCVITGDAFAGRLLFNSKKDGLKEPTMPWLKTIFPDIVLKGAFIRVRLTGDRVYEFKDCKVEAIAWDRVLGGQVMMGCKVTCAPALDSTLAPFIEALGGSCDVAIDSELPSDQQSLPLSRHGANEQPELGAEKPKRGRPRKGEDRPGTH